MLPPEPLPTKVRARRGDNAASTSADTGGEEVRIARVGLYVGEPVDNIVNTLLRLLIIPMCLIYNGSSGAVVDPGWGGCNAL